MATLSNADAKRHILNYILENEAYKNIKYSISGGSSVSVYNEKGTIVKEVDPKTKVTILNPEPLIVKIRGKDIRIFKTDIGYVKISNIEKPRVPKKTYKVYYGFLQKIPKNYNAHSFSGVNDEFSKNLHMSENIKESSDAIGISSINKALEEALEKKFIETGKIEGITVNVGNHPFTDVLGCVAVKTKGKEPKADMVLVSKKSNTNSLYPSCFISYKMGTKASDIQQYGGISDLKNTKEIKQLSAELAKLFGDTYDSKVSLVREIKDKNIKLMGMYGLNINGDWSINKCHVIIQGLAKFSGTTLSADHIISFRDIPTDLYRPVFATRKASDRSDFGIKGLRTGIYPFGFATSRKYKMMP